MARSLNDVVLVLEFYGRAIALVGLPDDDMHERSAVRHKRVVAKTYGYRIAEGPLVLTRFGAGLALIRKASVATCLRRGDCREHEQRQP